eukprot:4088228-Amphidinium_carterae.1
MSAGAISFNSSDRPTAKLSQSILSRLFSTHAFQLSKSTALPTLANARNYRLQMIPTAWKRSRSPSFLTRSPKHFSD